MLKLPFSEKSGEEKLWVASGCALSLIEMVVVMVMMRMMASMFV